MRKKLVRRYYRIHYQTGAVGQATHRTIGAALRNLHASRKAATRVGDCQEIFLKAYEKAPGASYGVEVPFAEEEGREIDNWEMYV